MLARPSGKEVDKRVRFEARSQAIRGTITSDLRNDHKFASKRARPEEFQLNPVLVASFIPRIFAEQHDSFTISGAGSDTVVAGGARQVSMATTHATHATRGMLHSPSHRVSHLLFDLGVHLEQVLAAVRVGRGEEVREEPLDEREDQNVADCSKRRPRTKAAATAKAGRLRWHDEKAVAASGVIVLDWGTFLCSHQGRQSFTCSSSFCLHGQHLLRSAPRLTCLREAWITKCLDGELSHLASQ